MKRFLRCLLIASLAATGLSQAAEEPSLQCNAGPAHKEFGGAPWLVYACSDGVAVAVVSAPQSPASPFVFFLQPDREGIKVYGEGAGAKSVTELAHAQLVKLSAGELAQLYAEARGAAASPKH